MMYTVITTSLWDLFFSYTVDSAQLSRIFDAVLPSETVWGCCSSTVLLKQRASATSLSATSPLLPSKKEAKAGAEKLRMLRLKAEQKCKEIERKEAERKLAALKKEERKLAVLKEKREVLERKAADHAKWLAQGQKVAPLVEGARAVAPLPLPTSAALPAELAFLAPEYSPLFLQCLLGALLGDGSLQPTRGSRSARFVLGQGKPNPGGMGFVVMVHDLLLSVPGLLGEAALFRGGPEDNTGAPDSRTGKMYESWRIRSATRPEFATLYKLFYGSGAKCFPHWLVPWADANFLAYLWSGDGCAPGRVLKPALVGSDSTFHVIGTPALATDGFDAVSRDHIRQLHRRFGIEMVDSLQKVVPTGEDQYGLRIRGGDKES